jgi:phage baseplate assembly protein W
MGTYSFKSSGILKTNQVAEQVRNAPVQLPIGIITPLRLGTDEGVFAMNFSLEDQIADNLRNLIQTNWGERLGLYEYGANLMPLLVDYSSQDDFDSLAIQRINAAVSKWMPYVSLEDFISSTDRIENINTAIVKLLITYTIPSIETKKRAIEISLYVI